MFRFSSLVEQVLFNMNTIFCPSAAAVMAGSIRGQAGNNSTSIVVIIRLHCPEKICCFNNACLSNENSVGLRLTKGWPLTVYTKKRTLFSSAASTVYYKGQLPSTRYGECQDVEFISCWIPTYFTTCHYKSMHKFLLEYTWKYKLYQHSWRKTRWEIFCYNIFVYMDCRRAVHWSMKSFDILKFCNTSYNTCSKRLSNIIY